MGRKLTFGTSRRRSTSGQKLRPQFLGVPVTIHILDHRIELSEPLPVFANIRPVAVLLRIIDGGEAMPPNPD
jgi:hypothetical protein